jgi:hypothetical protein
MNDFQAIHVEYLRASRTIETVLVSCSNLTKVLFVYNHEGTSYRVFASHLGLINFFQDKAEEDYHFDTEEELDDFLGRVEI